LTDTSLYILYKRQNITAIEGILESVL